MIVKLLTEHYLEFLSSKETHPSLHMSKCLIVGNLMHWPNYVSFEVGTGPSAILVYGVLLLCYQALFFMSI